MATAEETRAAEQSNGAVEQHPPDPLPALWPKNRKIEIIGLTGEYASGKTLFGLTIDPARTIVYDTEKSSGSYEGLGFARVDIADDMLRRYPGGYKPIDTFNYWLSSIRMLKPGQYRVVMLDTASEIESGLCDWVRQNPATFGHTRKQYESMEGLFWGDVKEYWKSILSDIAARCECFVFTSHMKAVWAGSKPVPGKRAPKGKETLMELASLYLRMERKKDSHGRMPAKPSAIVLKERLAKASFDPVTGEVDIRPTLPPRLPEATPAAIRRYMETPANYDKLAKGERLEDEGLSADERLVLETQKAEAEATSNTAKVNAMELMRAAANKQQHQQTAPSTPPQDNAAATTTAASSPAAEAGASSSSPAAEGKDPYQPTRDWAEKEAAKPAPDSLCTAEQRTRIASLFERLQVSPDKQDEILAKVGAKSARNLTVELADGLISKLVAHELGMSKTSQQQQTSQQQAEASPPKN